MLMLLKVKIKQCRGRVTYSGFMFIQNVLVVREMVYSYTAFDITYLVTYLVIYLLT